MTRRTVAAASGVKCRLMNINSIISLFDTAYDEDVLLQEAKRDGGERTKGRGEDEEMKGEKGELSVEREDENGRRGSRRGKTSGRG